MECKRKMINTRFIIIIIIIVKNYYYDTINMDAKNDCLVFRGEYMYGLFVSHKINCATVGKTHKSFY